MKTTKAVNNEGTSVSTLTSIIANKAIAGRMLEPLFRKTETIEQFVAGLKAAPPQRVLTKTGSYFDREAIDSFEWDTARLMSTASTVARAIYAMNDDVSRDDITVSLDAIYDQVLMLDSHYAALRDQNDATLVYEDITLRTKHGDFDAFGESSGHTKASSDEGVMQTSLHSAEDVLDVPIDRMIHTRLNWNGVIYSMSWPTDCDMWTPLIDAMAASALRSIDYAVEDMKVWEAAKKAGKKEAPKPRIPSKVKATLARRMTDISQPFNRMPLGHLAHWRVSSAMRWIWRYTATSKETIARFEAQISRVMEAAHVEAVSGRPSQLCRMQSESGNQNTYETAFGTIVEGVYDGLEIGQEGGFAPVEAWEVTVRWYRQVIEVLDRDLEGLATIYTALQGMEQSVIGLWAENGDGMPTEPPLYWNNRGPYFTEVAALKALADERAERAEKDKALKGDALAEALKGLQFGSFL